MKMYVKTNILKKTLSMLITLSMIFPSQLFAAQVEVTSNSGVHFRVASTESNGFSTLKSYRLLQKGSILEIPDRFVVKVNGKPDVNASLNNWIKSNNLTTQRFDNNGRPSYDHFFEVKIVKAVGESDINGQTGYVALNAIAQSNGLKLRTTEQTALFDPPKVETPVPVPENTRPSEYANNSNGNTEAAAVCYDCDNQSSFMQKLMGDLNTELQKVANKTNNFFRSKRPSDSFQAIAKNFERTCFGLKFDDFVDYIKETTPKSNVPAEIMLGIMTQESAGICHALGDLTSTSKSVGLFQLNTRTITNVNPCSRQQLNALQGKSISQMASDSSLKCLQNPAINLAGGIKVLLDKYRTVTRGQQPIYNSWEFMSAEQKDKFRIALAAYNGGEGWTNIASSDIQFAKQKFGIDLKNDWETTRLFMFRHKLRANGYVGQNKSRSYANEIGNVAYVDAILGRGTGSLTQRGFTDQWQVALNSSAPISVATREN